MKYIHTYPYIYITFSPKNSIFHVSIMLSQTRFDNNKVIYIYTDNKLIGTEVSFSWWMKPLKLSLRNASNRLDSTLSFNGTWSFDWHLTADKAISIGLMSAQSVDRSQLAKKQRETAGIVKCFPTNPKLCCLHSVSDALVFELEDT